MIHVVLFVVQTKNVKCYGFVIFSFENDHFLGEEVKSVKC